MNDVLKPAMGMILIIVVIAGLMIPYVSELNDNIVDKNDNPIGSYMLRDANDNNSNVTIEINNAGTFVNGFDASEGYHVVIMDSGMIIIYRGAVGIYDTINDKHVMYETSGTTLELKNGTMSYSISGTEYTMAYENVLYPANKGNYSAYNNNTSINASIDDEVYMVSQEPGSQPRLVATYKNGSQTGLLGPVTITGNELVNYSTQLTYTVPSALSEDGKSYIYSRGRSIVIPGETPYTLNTILIAPNTYDTVGKMGMVISLTNLMPLFIGILGFAALGIYITRLKQ